jgi:hypothetical protein
MLALDSVALVVMARCLQVPDQHAVGWGTTEPPIS